MDILDMKILSSLLNNCRESDRQIGKKFGISGGAVGSRINKMKKSGLIENFCMKVEPPVLGQNIVYIVVSGQDIEKIMKQVKLVGLPFVIVPCVGGTTVCGIVVKEDVEQKIELLKNLMNDVRILLIFEAESEEIDFNITKTDLEVLRELIDDPRQKIEELSKKTKLSTKTINRILEKFEENESIQFTLVYDPSKIEGYIPYAVLSVVNGEIKTILKNLEKQFGDSFMMIPFLAKNQIVLFLYSENIFQMDAMTEKIRQVDGILSTDLFIPKKINMPKEWMKKSIESLTKTEKLHIMYN
ncbi:winged helix-turn-helix transcriptional regulator [Candidatus Nitrosopelagicus sp.]|nr:winged helix-turn-helix transcriptional regulator [Candidatus Nitrosopelagicus sp.]